MPLRILPLLLFFLCSTLHLSAQDSTGLLRGRLTDTRGRALEAALVTARNGRGKAVGSTQTDSAGRYSFRLPAGDRLSILFDADGVVKTIRLTLEPGPETVRDVELPYVAVNQGVVVSGQRVRTDPGSVDITDLPNIQLGVALNDDAIASRLQILTGGKVNDLSTQYSVRGGNYDENLVYVNDFEIYRPFLTRSGQQEGLSFVNSDLAANVYFSVGGFQSRYGDKMSSVLDVTYKHPTKFAGSASISLLGANGHVEGASRNGKLTYLVGVRQKTNQYILQSQPTTGVYNPSFTDLQGLVHYDVNSRWEVELLANYARNRFSFVPEEQTTSFGVLSQAFQLQVFYTGHEIDQFDSRFGGLSTTYKPNRRLRLKLLASGFQTDERETYDIGGEYLLGELETDLGKASFGQIKTSLGTGIIQSHARNYLKVNVGTLAHRGWYDGGRHQISWGLDASVFSINDQLSEWERRDSAGFTQPYAPDGTIRMAKYYRTSADFNYQRYSGFLQDNFRFGDDSVSGRFFAVSAGLRFNYSELNGEFILSPRVQATYNSSRRTQFKAAAGLYAQPPIYREMRDLNGNVNTQIRAQKSTHFVLGAEHNFDLRDRNARLTAEIYYKKLTDLVPYEYDNVRIRYFGQNNAVGYAYGGEVRLYGDLVRDAPSFISVGVLKTAEDITNDFIQYKGTDGRDSARAYPGYVPRPGDQRFMLGMYFQDYLPHNKNFKAHLNGLYGTGLPFGPPDGQRYGDTLRLPDYKRVDIGVSALLVSGNKRDRPYYSFFRQLESVWLSVECFNLLGLRNTISYTWIQDQSSGRTFAVPNRLTARLLNVKLIVKF